MSKKNKIYWFEGVTEKGVKSLLTDENSKYRWLRSQKNRRILVVLMALGTALVAAGSYWPTLKTNLNLSDGTSVVIYSVTAIFAIFAVLLGYLFLRISVRGIADAPDELLDERQINSNWFLELANNFLPQQELFPRPSKQQVLFDFSTRLTLLLRCCINAI